MRQVDGLISRRIGQKQNTYNKPKIELPNNIKWSFVKTLLHIFFILIITGFVAVIFYFTSIKVGFIKDRINLTRQFLSGHYLVILQNNSELRPTGGFIGSFATIDSNFLYPRKVDVNTNIYKLDDKYDYIMQIEPPDVLKKGLSLKYWALRDSNWSVDYPTAAQNISWFYEEETKSNVDGVIAINASFVRDMLKITGPINLEKYNTEVNYDNFFDILQYKIEKEYFQNETNKEINEPKTILKDLMPEIISKMKKQKLSVITSFLTKEIKQKQILAYSHNPIIEKYIIKYGLGGEVKSTTKDYLYINNANLAGLKSSLNINQQSKLNVFVDDQQAVSNYLTITRTHVGSGKWPDGDNKNYTRILVPKDSIILSAQLNGKDCLSEIDVVMENDKTIFGIWFNTDVGKTSELSISYRLPFKLADPNKYELLWQKQPGTISDYLDLIVNDSLIYSGDVDSDVLIK